MSRPLLEGGPSTSASTFLTDLYGRLDDALVRAAGVFAGTAGMGGRVGAFTAAYDTAARDTFGAGRDLAGAVAKLGLMVAVTFDNYVRADHAADVEALGHLGRSAALGRAPYPFVEGPPSAAGDNGGAPWIWHLLTRLRPDAVWPDVATGMVRRAAGGWADLAGAYGESRSYLDCAVAELGTHRAPELPLATAALEDMARHTSTYADQCGQMSRTLMSVADAADVAISRLEAKCHHAQLEIEAGGLAALAATALTAGAAGAPSGAAANALLAGSVGLTIAELATDFLATVATLCESFAVMEPVVEASAVAAGGILEARTVEGSFDQLASGAGQVLPDVDYGITIQRLRELEETTNTHVLRRHVGRTTQQLANRLDGSPKLWQASTFPDERTAVQCINQVLHSHTKDINEWIGGSDGRPLALDATSEDAVGTVLHRSNGLTLTGRFRVVIVRDHEVTAGFRVLTAYPTSP